jgi:hypothetical protein
MEKVNWNFITELHWLSIINFDKSFANSIIFDIKLALDWKKNVNIMSFLWFNVYDIWKIWIHLLEIQNQNERDKLKNAITSNFRPWKFKWISAEILEKNRQTPESIWYFDYNWKFYIILCAYNSKIDEVNEELENL